MKINLKKINYYYLTTGKNLNKINHINDIFKNLNITQVNPCMDNNLDKQRSGTTGAGRMIDLGLKNQIPGEPFKPFIILEDDISFFDNIPENIDIPLNADFIYVGVSSAGMGSNYRAGENLYAIDYNEQYLRVFNMLSTHAIMICSPLGASVYSKCMLEAHMSVKLGRFKGKWDCYLATIQPYYNIYALKTPLFFQDKNFGGMEDETKIKFNNGKIIYINDTNRSDVYKNPSKNHKWNQIITLKLSNFEEIYKTKLIKS